MSFIWLAEALAHNHAALMGDRIGVIRTVRIYTSACCVRQRDTYALVRLTERDIMMSQRQAGGPFGLESWTGSIGQ